MSLWFFLKSGQRTILSILPEIRTPSSVIDAAKKNFHSLCATGWTSNSKLLQNAQCSLNDGTRGMKTKGKLQLRCKDCYIVHRKGRAYVMCKSYPRHKQQQTVKKEKNTWILTHAMQSKVRPW